MAYTTPTIMKRNIQIILLFSIFMPLLCFAQDKKDKEKWDVNNPPGPYKDVSFTIEEGTWMNLDISPDGSQIVFDLLGDIYTIPANGGQAKILKEGLAYEVQPRFSPDGKKILYTSDLGGGDNIWWMNSDGSDAKQITKEKFRLLNNPAWMPDGEYLIARKHFTSTRSLGAGEMWIYHISGGDGLQLTEMKNKQQDVNEPTVSPDGRYVYFSEDMYPGGYFKYNKDPNKQIYMIRRYDREKGKIENVVSGPGGAHRPQISNDGKFLAYIKRVRTKTVLYVHNLETGEEWPVFDGLSKDQQEAWAIFGVYTGFDWFPDDQHIAIWGKGKLWKVNVNSTNSTNIPFKVNAKHRIAETVKGEYPAFEEEFSVKVIRQAVTSPDENWVVFNAIGHLWKKKLPNGKPQRLTTSNDFEYEPSFSKDGKTIVYTTWNDEEMGTIQKISLAGGSPQKLTTTKGIYRQPSFSPDGKNILFRKEGGNNHLGFTHTKNPGIYYIPVQGGEMTKVIAKGNQPQFSADGQRVFFVTGGGLDKKYNSCKLDGSDEKTLFKAKYATQITPSPDNKWVAFTEFFKVYIAAMPKTGKTIDLNKDTKAIPVVQVARDEGINLHWSADSKKLHWTLGEEYFSNNLKDRFLFMENAPDSLPPIDTVGLSIGLSIKSDKPKGEIVFTNARIITMDEANSVIENGFVVVEGNRITQIGAMSDQKLTNGADVRDMSGKTIMPGLVDVHAHLGTWRTGHSPQKQWSYYANLAYGVTTTHDPSSNTEMVFAQSELVKSGNMIGPRIFSTGRILYGADGDFKAVINNLEDARSALRRTKAFGAFSVKSYNQPRRDQRQQVIQAARELDMIVVPEGGSFFYHNMSMVVDGHTGVEHNIPVAPLYSDVLKLWSFTQTGNTPTLVVNYGGINGEYYWYQKTNVWEKERLLSFTPRAIVDARSRHRTIIPEEEYENGHILVSKSLKKLTDAGVKINLGSHGQLQGLAAHWELWMMEQGGMTNMEVLRAGTMNGAEYIGMSKDIGSLEKGKLADLIIMDKNPLDNILNTESVQFTMINGRLYDCDTMNEIADRKQNRGQFFWELPNYNSNFQWHEHTHSFEAHKCSCGN